MTDSPAMPARPWSKLLPEALMLASVSWLLFGEPRWFVIDHDALMFAAFADGALLMASGTLVDLASRLKKPPPWWIAPLVLAGLFFAFPESWQMLREAWTLGWWALLPFAWSIIERVRELWTLPRASDLEKIRRRVLVFDRLYVAIVIGFLWIAGSMLLHFAFDVPFFDLFGAGTLPWVLLAFYAVNCANVVRVHRPAFARRPRSLVPYFDGNQAQSLDPL